MAIEGKITSLYTDKNKTEAILPRTKVKAVSDDNGIGLDATLNQIQSDLSNKATEAYVKNAIANAQLNGDGNEVDLSGYATKDELNALDADDVGAVAKSGDTMTGMLTLPKLVVANSDWAQQIPFWNGDKEVGGIYRQNENGLFVLYFRHPNANGQEYYCMPLPDASIGENVWYDILTSKRAVTVAQGGTGATTTADALKNLSAFRDLGNNVMPYRDIINNWSIIDSGYSYYNELYLEGQPSQYGLLLHFHYSSEVFQFWRCLPGGATYWRSGNASGWHGSWTKVYDTANKPDITELPGFSDRVYDALGWRSKNTFLAAPSNDNGYANFRKLVADDLPTVPISKGGTGVTTDKAIALKAYPVNSIYMSVNSKSPASLFGGTWTQLKDRFLLGAGSYSNGATGGASTVTLTESQIPSHYHDIEILSGATGTGAYYLQPPATNNSGSWARANTLSSGGGKSHNNMPPYLVVYMWKRTA